MGTDYDWNDNYRGFPFPNCVSFSYGRAWTFHGNGYGYGYPFSLTCWRKSYSDGYNYGYSLSSTCCRNSHDYNYCYSLSCGPKPYCYSNRYGNSFPCFGNSHDYRYSDSFSFPRFGNSHNYDYGYSLSCCRKSYSYGYSDSFSFSCSTDPHHHYYTFTHCDRDCDCDPNGRGIVVDNTYRYLDVYPDSLAYSSGVSQSLSNSSDNNNSFVHCSGNSDSDTNCVQYSWPPSFSDGNPVSHQHSFQQSPACLRQCRKYCFQQYWNHRRFRNWRCSVGCHSNYSRVLPHGKPSSSYCLASVIPSITHHHERSACLLPGRCGSCAHDDCPSTHILCSPNQ